MSPRSARPATLAAVFAIVFVSSIGGSLLAQAPGRASLAAPAQPPQPAGPGGLKSPAELDLSEATARQMRTRLFAKVPELNGMMYGFQQMDRNGRRVYGHEGATQWFHSQMALLPDDHVGIFVSYNTDTGQAARAILVNAFLDRYFPRVTPGPASGRMREPTGTFAGSYRAARMSHTTLAKVASPVMTWTVAELPDGRLIATGAGPEPMRFVEIGADRKH